MLDVTVSGLLVVVLLPVWLVVVGAMSLDMACCRRDRGGLLYREPRVSRGRIFQLLKFPLGLASWIWAVVVISVVGGFVVAPIVVAFGGVIQIDPWWVADTPGEAWIATLIGLVAVVPALHLLNGLAYLWAVFARLMLGRREPREPVHEGWSADPVRAPVPAL